MLPWQKKCDLQAAEKCAVQAGKRPVDDAEAGVILLITGSVAEFYVEPMLQRVGDIDVMFHLNTWLASIYCS